MGVEQDSVCGRPYAAVEGTQSPTTAAATCREDVRQVEPHLTLLPYNGIYLTNIYLIIYIHIYIHITPGISQNI